MLFVRKNKKEVVRTHIVCELFGISNNRIRAYNRTKKIVFMLLKRNRNWYGTLHFCYIFAQY